MIGFREGCDCGMGILRVINKIETMKVLKQNAAILNLDLTSAYDTVNRKKLWQILRER